MDPSINGSYKSSPLYQQLSQHSKELEVLGQLTVGDKLMIVKSESGPKAEVSKKGFFQGVIRTANRVGGDALATAQDTLSYVHELNNRTLHSIVSLQDPSKLNKDELQSYLTVVEKLNTQSVAALRGLEVLQQTYQGKVTDVGKSVSERLEEEKIKLAHTLEEGNKIYENLKMAPFREMLALNEEIQLLQSAGNQDIHQMNQAESAEQAVEIIEKKEKLEQLLYETRNENDPKKLKKVKSVANHKDGVGQFGRDFHRWKSVKLNGTELFRKGTNAKESRNQIASALGKDRTMLIAPLATQTCLSDLTKDLNQKYQNPENPHYLSGAGTDIAINIIDQNVHVKLTTNFTISIFDEKGDNVYQCSRIVKREIFIPIADLDKMADPATKTDPVEFPNMRVIDSYSREIPDAEIAKGLMKFA